MHRHARHRLLGVGRWYASRAGASSPVSYFAVLGLPQSCTKEDVKAAFREARRSAAAAQTVTSCAADAPGVQKAKQLHPDASGQASAAGFVRLLTAYKVRRACTDLGWAVPAHGPDSCRLPGAERPSPAAAARAEPEPCRSAHGQELGQRGR